MKNIKLHPAVRISVIYLVVAGLWVLLSDLVINILIRNQDTLITVSSIKGVAFVAVMAVLLYLERVSAERTNQRAAAALSQANHRYRDIFENAPIGIFRATREGKYIDANATFAQMLGYATTQELVDSSAQASQGLLKEMEALFQAGSGTMRYEWRYQRRDGRVIDTHLNARVVTDNEGGPPYLEGFIEDITERKLAERKIIQMADIVESSLDAIYSADLDSNFTSWNSAACDIYGYTAAEVESRSTTILLPPDPVPGRARIRDMIQLGRHVSQYETVHRRKDGSTFEVSLTTSPIRDELWQVTGISVIARDITERKRMAQRVEEQQQTLREYAHRLVQSQEDERKRLSRELHDDTLQDLVALAQRAELSRTALERDPVVAMHRLEDLQVLAKDMVVKLRRISNDLRPLILEDLGIAAAVHYIGDELAHSMPDCTVQCVITGDERRLEPDLEVTAFRIVQQAVNNVRAHATDATHAELRLTFEDDALIASVEDDGPGFVFVDMHELLRQGHLGIAGMQERASLFGGEVAITSHPQAGTTITLRLPYTQTVTQTATQTHDSSFQSVTGVEE